VKSRGISNQPTFNQDHTDLAATVTCYRKFATRVAYIGVQNKKLLQHEFTNNIAEASSFKSHTLSSVTVPADSHSPQKHEIR
jgi:hypothetical protein